MPNINTLRDLLERTDENSKVAITDGSIIPGYFYCIAIIENRTIVYLLELNIKDKGASIIKGHVIISGNVDDNKRAFKGNSFLGGEPVNMVDLVNVGSTFLKMI